MEKCAQQRSGIAVPADVVAGVSVPGSAQAGGLVNPVSLEPSPFSDLTLGGFLDGQAAASPDRPFLSYPDRNHQVTYADFNAKVDRLAKGLLAIGIEKGEHVGIWAKNIPDWLAFALATVRIGAVLVPIDAVCDGHELDYLLTQADLKTIALAERYRNVDHLKTVYELIPELKKDPRSDLKPERYPWLEHVIYLGGDKQCGMYNIRELLILGQHAEDRWLDAVKAGVSNIDVAVMQFTSGTTGFPKGVILTHRSLLNTACSVSQRMNLSEEDRVCLPVPLSQGFGLILGAMAALSRGGTLVPIEEYDPLVTLATIQKDRCTAILGTPEMFASLLDHPMFDMFDMSSLRTGIIAGGPGASEILERVATEMHCPEITVAFGLTETSSVFLQSAADDPLDRRTRTVGKSLPHVEVKVVRPKSGETLPPGTEGELCCRGYNVMEGYYDKPEETGKVRDADGWFHSGDLGEIDEEGYCKITGRLRDMIVRRDEIIYPHEIERVILAVSGVQDAQVVGIPDKEVGEVVGAFLILEKDSELTPIEIREQIRGRLCEHKIPKYIFIVDAYPLTSDGKVQKYKLRKIAREMLAVDIEVFERRQRRGEARPSVTLHADQCKACGLCIEHCLKEVLRPGTHVNVHGYLATRYVGEGCIGCATCYYVCPETDAITVYPPLSKLQR